MNALGDGIEFFKERAKPEIIAELLDACTIWIDPECHRLLPVWAPYTFRKAPLYQADWQTRQTNRNEPKFEGNVAAGKAQNSYLGFGSRNAELRPNWACCHIWGNDDATFQSNHAEVNDPRFFTCAANMVLVPAPLKTFTDTIPEVKVALRHAARLLYDFWPEARSKPDASKAAGFMPEGWRVRNTIRYRTASAETLGRVHRRYAELKELQRSAGAFYPREQVNDVAGYWATQLPSSLFGTWPA